jgi:hypothetical protein
MPQELLSRRLDTTLAHAGSAETNDSNLTVVAQAEALCHSRLFKPLKMTPPTFTAANARRSARGRRDRGIFISALINE